MSASGRSPAPKKTTAKSPVPKKKPTEKPAATASSLALEDASNSKDAAANMAKRADSPKWLQDFCAKHSDVLYKMVLVASVILPLAPSIALLAFIVPKTTFGGAFVEWVIDDRSDVQVIVSVIVSTLTYLNILIISRLLYDCHIRFKENFVFKFLLSNVGLGDNDQGGDDGDSKKQPKKDLDKKDVEQLTKWWEFISNGKWTWYDFSVGLCCFALLYAPHVIWVGALTPNVVSTGVGQGNDALQPQYSSGTASNWANNVKQSGIDCDKDFKLPSQDLRVQTFTGCAANDISYSVFNNIQSASLIMQPGAQYPHNKLDNSSYTYNGRSYGVGSAAGVKLIDVDPSLGVEEGRNYTEPGYSTSLYCVRNETSAFQLQRTNASSTSGASGVNIFEAVGRLPLGQANVTGYSIVAQASNQDAVAWTTASSGSDHILSIAVSGSYYSDLANIQCRITFSPATYHVFQNYTARTLDVERLNASSTFNPDGLANTAIAQLGFISQFQSSPFSSDLGDNLISNAMILAFLRGKDSPNEQDILDSVADAVSVALDDVLSYVAASQFAQTVGPGATNVDYTPIYQRVQLGVEKWIVVAMILTGALFVLGIARIIFKFYRRSHPKPAKELTSKSDKEGLLHGEPQMMV